MAYLSQNNRSKLVKKNLPLEENATKHLECKFIFTSFFLFMVDLDSLCSKDESRAGRPARVTQENRKETRSDKWIVCLKKERSFGEHACL